MTVKLDISGQFPMVNTYNQDFTDLGTNNLVNIAGGDMNLANPSLNGWYFFENGSNANPDITAGDGNGLQGDTYNYGTSAALDRAFGGMQSGSLVPSFGFHFTNQTGATITSLVITYTGEQWRMGNAGRLDRLDFQYSQDATAINNGLWLDVDMLDFTAPVITGTPRALDGNAVANRVLYSINISGLNIPVSGGFLIRWLDFNSAGADDGLAIDDVSIVPGYAAPQPGHFRSILNGEWTDPATWEYSVDNINWGAATGIPTSAAASVTIRNPHHIIYQAFQVVDEVLISAGAMLEHRSGILAVNDGPGVDLDIQHAGILVLSSAGNPPVFQGSGAAINVQTNGMVRVAAGGLTSIPGAGVHAPNFQYQHQSVLEFVLPTAFGTVGVTYFPNAGPAVIPVFRITQPIGVSVGSVSPTIINGVFEANGNINFANSGSKIFRNGIRGTGNINGAASGKFIINGVSAELGGAGSLVLPSGGLEIGSPAGTTVTMISNKNITGNINLLNTGGGSFIETGLYNLTVSGVITGGSVNSYIRTNQNAGALTLLNTGSAGKTFPVGETSFNPLILSAATGTADFTVRVRSGIHDPGGAIPTDAVNRTWYVHANAVTTGVTMIFQYGTQPGELTGAAVIQPTSMELLQSDYLTWHLVPGNASIMSVPGPAFTVTTMAAVTVNNSASPYALGTSGTIFLANDHYVHCAVQQSGLMAEIKFQANEIAGIARFEVERSTGNNIFSRIGEIYPEPSRLEYQYMDTITYTVSRYRVKLMLADSSARYSNIAVLRREDPVELSLSIIPNPVDQVANLRIVSARIQDISIILFTGDGREVYRSGLRVPAGRSHIAIPVSGLPAAVYYMAVYYGNNTKRLRLVKQ